MGNYRTISLVGESPSAQYPTIPTNGRPPRRSGAEQSRASSHGVEADGGDPAEAIPAGVPAGERPRAIPPLRRRRALPPPRVALLPVRARSPAPHFLSSPLLLLFGSCDLSAGFGLRFRDSGWELTVCSFGVCAFRRLLGDRSPFTQQNWQGDSLDRDEENNRIQRNVLVSSLG